MSGPGASARLRRKTKEKRTGPKEGASSSGPILKTLAATSTIAKALPPQANGRELFRHYNTINNVNNAV